MTIKKTTVSDLEAFIEDSTKAHNTPLSKEDIERINKISEEAEIEESGDDMEIPFVAKDNNDFLEQTQP
ncbi:MAG: hypothetical protein QF441_07340 [Bacteriovoracaceae bacterium]|jgi:hypothetical protein|nr:hypothetical protein [Bacteriovoracaceae bacterium]